MADLALLDTDTLLEVMSGCGVFHSFPGADMAIVQERLDRAVALAKAYGTTRLILFGSALTRPSHVRDLDLACDGVEGWKLYELGACLEEALQMPLDLIPLTPATRLTHLIERQGKVLL